MENANYDEGSGSGDSIVIEGTPKTQRRRKSRVNKRKRQEGVQSRIQSAAAALDARVRGDDSSDRSCSPPPVTPAKKKGRTKSSVIWKHCNNKDVKGRTLRGHTLKMSKNDREGGFQKMSKKAGRLI